MIYKKVFEGVEKSRQTDILFQHLKIPFSEIYTFSQMLEAVLLTAAVLPFL